jgi:hypothetical protein
MSGRLEEYWAAHRRLFATKENFLTLDLKDWHRSCRRVSRLDDEPLTAISTHALQSVSDYLSWNRYSYVVNPRKARQ